MSDEDQSSRSEKMGFNATWSMAVGGMVGGGIFSVLGVIISIAGSWAWLSFIIAGLIALLTGYSYQMLSTKFGEGGGAFTFLRDVNMPSFAGSLSWVLIVGYVLTISVYAFTFGHYLGAFAGIDAVWFPRVAAASIVIVLIGVNLLGVSEASWLEIITVWGKLIILLGLATLGLVQFSPEALRYEATPLSSPLGALIGAASIFMAYEGFQLLTYDYDDIRNPKRTLRWAIISAIACVIVIYVAVAMGATSLVGAESMVEHKEIALARAGEQALGVAGLWAVSIAAAFSTASAINATLFATARLSERVARDAELPAFFEHRNRNGIPDRSIIVLGGAGLVLAVIGNLTHLVEAASLAFLFTFAVVNTIAARRCEGIAWLSWLGSVGALAAALALTVRLAMNAPIALSVLAALALIATLGRPIILKHFVTDQDGSQGNEEKES